MISPVKIALHVERWTAGHDQPPLSRRIKFGIGATVVTLVILVYPGQMVLPLNVLLLSPTVFSSWWHSRVPFVATAVAAGLLLLPGAVGMVTLGSHVGDRTSTQPASSVSSRAAC